MKKAVIFDLDGTLADTLSGITHFVNRAMTAYGLSSFSKDTIKIMVGAGAKSLIKRALARHNASHLFDEVFPFFTSIYNAHPDHDLKAYEGISEMLTCLRDKGIKIAVTSNKPHETAAPICHQPFPGQIDFALGNKEGIPHKPDITAIRMAWQALGVTPEECIYVGDTDCDMQTGKNGGMLTVGVQWGFRAEKELWDNGADHVISHPSELLELLK